MIQNTNYGASKSYVDESLGVWKWRASKSYSVGDLVTYAGGIYRSLINDNVGNLPTSTQTNAWGAVKGANPASGATDTTLVTANWVSQTGNSAPNNLIHKTGNETISGIKLGTNIQSGVGATVTGATAGTDWVRLGYMNAVNNGHPLVVLMVTCRQITVGGRENYFGILAFGASNVQSVKPPRWLIAGSGINPSDFKLALKNDPTLGYIAELWCRVPGTNNFGWTCSSLLMDRDFQAWHGIVYEAPVAEPDWSTYLSYANSTILHTQ